MHTSPDWALVNVGRLGRDDEERQDKSENHDSIR